MAQFATAPDASSFLRTGAIAGGISTLFFTVVHHIFISNIWFTFPLMLLAGALCGLSISWSFGALSAKRTVGGWLRYNLLYVIVLVLLGITSALVFEPVTSMMALMQADGPPDALIAQALPMTLVFTVLAATVLTALHGFSWRNFGAILMTASVLVLLLGLNISALGLVSIPRGSFFLVAEFLSLVVLLGAVYAAAFLGLEWKSFTTNNRNRRVS